MNKILLSHTIDTENSSFPSSIAVKVQPVDAKQTSFCPVSFLHSPTLCGLTIRGLLGSSFLITTPVCLLLPLGSAEE